MGNLVMAFRGLWTHVGQGLPDGVARRVFAVDASAGASTTWGALPPHHCYIEAHDETLDALNAAQVPIGRLQGWQVQVVNADDHPVDANLTVPSLSDYVQSMSLWKDLLLPGAPIRAACFVDIQVGSIDTHQYEPPPNDPELTGVYTTWRVNTNGDPQLLFTPRAGKSIQVTIPSTPEGATLADGVLGSLALHNSTEDLSDTPNDFVLSYLARENGIPAVFLSQLPGQNPVNSRQRVDLTPSCSNSQYP